MLWPKGKSIQILYSCAGDIVHHRSSVWIDTMPFKTCAKNKLSLGSEQWSSCSFTEAHEMQPTLLPM